MRGWNPGAVNELGVVPKWAGGGPRLRREGIFLGFPVWIALAPALLSVWCPIRTLRGSAYAPAPSYVSLRIIDAAEI
jgi:hypothetical protein